MKTKLLFLFALLSTNFSFAQFSGNALDFDGTNDMVVINTVPSYFSTLGSNDFTIEAWVNPRGSAFQRIFFAQPSTTNFVSIGPSTGNVIYFYVVVNGTTHSVATTTSIAQNQWTHVAGRWTAATSTVEVLFNGVGQPTAAGGGSSTGTSGLMTLGARPGGSQNFNGGLDEVRLWNEARTDCQIIANMNHHITGAETNLTFNFDFNQGVAAGNNTGVITLPDLTGNSYNGVLTNFSLTTATSNWIASAATISTSASTQNSGGPSITSEPSTVILCSSGNANYTIASGASSLLWQENNGSGWTNLTNTIPYSGVTTNSLLITGPTNMMNGYRYRCIATTGLCSSTSDSAMLFVSNITSSIASQNDEQCNGGSNANAAINIPTGGVGTYTYDWTPGNPNGDGTTGIVSLTAGTWTCTITDSVGCTSTQSFTITEPTPMITTTVASSILCNGGNSNVTVTTTGGTSPYSGTGTFSETAGTYTFIITDANACADTTNITLTEPAVLAASVTTTTNPTTCGGSDGAINITVSGGTTAYSFSWNSSATTEDLTGIVAGSYSCTINDANGCTTTASATLTDPTLPIVTFNCNFDSVCQANSSFTLSGESPAGGVFSGPGVTGNTFDPFNANSGENIITYTYTNSNGCSASAVDSIYVDLCLGITADKKIDFSIMPNPNNGTFYITLNILEPVEVIIYDELGQLVSSQQVKSQSPTQLNIKDSGIYLITVISSDGQRTSRRVVVGK